jgi:hypothetical protein
LNGEPERAPERRAGNLESVQDVADSPAQGEVERIRVLGRTLDSDESGGVEAPRIAVLVKCRRTLYDF